MVDIKGNELRVFHPLLCISQIKLLRSESEIDHFSNQLCSFPDIGGIDKNCMNIDDCKCFISIFKNSVSGQSFGENDNMNPLVSICQ